MWKYEDVKNVQIIFYEPNWRIRMKLSLRRTLVLKQFCSAKLRTLKCPEASSGSSSDTTGDE